MKAAIGSIVSLYYDSPRELAMGHCLITKTGRVYQIVDLHRQTRGQHVGRWHIRALVAESIPAGSITHPIYWYRRQKRRIT